MGIVFIVIGGFAALITAIGGFSVAPTSAPQQAVQELRFVDALIALGIAALGYVIYRLEHPVRVVPPDPRLARLMLLNCRVDGLRFDAAGAPIFGDSNYLGMWNDAEKAKVLAALERLALTPDG